MFRHWPSGKPARFSAASMHPNDKTFVIDRLKIPILSALGHHLVASPQKIMIQFSWLGALTHERRSPRIHAGHDVLDGAVFTRRVHCLKNQEQRQAVLRVELFCIWLAMALLCSSSFSACFLDSPRWCRQGRSP